MKKNPLKQVFADFNKENLQKFSIGFDWLQIHVESKILFAEHNTAHYQITRTGQSKVFKNIFTIKNLLHNRIVATYATDALEQIMQPNHGVIKIDNFYLYYRAADLKNFITHLLKNLQLKFIAVTRLDIAYDFNSFNNRRHPQNFIRDFLNGKILKLKQTKFQASGKHDEKNVFEWISFGSKTSTINYKLYNKTAEMRNEHSKPHIIKYWKNSNLNLLQDVWRLEFTINSNKNFITHEKNQIAFNSKDVLNLDVIASIFYQLFKKFFDFRFAENKSRKDRMKPVNLLFFPASFKQGFVTKANPAEKDSSRAVRIFLKKMNEHGNEMRGFDDDFSIDARSIISKLISVYKLENWADKHGILYDSGNYAEDLGKVHEAAELQCDKTSILSPPKPPSPIINYSVNFSV